MDTAQERIYNAMHDSGWFRTPGCYVLFDGQYGSTGKGLLASVIAQAHGDRISMVATNAGPNSGHTAFTFKDGTVPNGTEVMTQQIPVASVMMGQMGIEHICYLNGGAVIERAILGDEVKKWGVDSTRYCVHPAAAIISSRHQGEQLSHIASTGKGVGPAMAEKLGRTEGAVWGTKSDVEGVDTCAINDFGGHVVLVETAQGWSLGINSGFYPYTTSRECSVSQALADLGVSPRALRKSIVSLRVHPIRVGNTKDGWSGPVYDDQKETSWEELGQEAERTTVTKRVRRVFTWSDRQFGDMLRANRPDALFLNFLNYLPDGEQQQFVDHVIGEYLRIMGHRPDFVLGGFGPLNSDVRLVSW